MEALKNKLNSRRGASILLALLFLLVCMMAAASILMAAASDAGKIKSNQVEQQKYLTLSSALNLLVDELEKVTYVGTYECTVEDVMKYVYDEDGMLVYEKDAEGNPTTTLKQEHDYYKRTYTQISAADVLEDSSLLLTSSLKWDLSVLPLYNDLDLIFASNFKPPTNPGNPRDVYEYHKLGDDDVGDVATTQPYTLMFTLNPTAESYGGLADPVRIKVEMRDDGSIVLTATLMEPDTKDDMGNVTKKGEETGYIMSAVLRPNISDNDQWPKQVLLLDDNIVEEDGNYPYTYTGETTTSITWKLDHIAKGEGA